MPQYSGQPQELHANASHLGPGVAALLDRSSDFTLGLNIFSGALHAGPPNLSLMPCELEPLGSLPLDTEGSAAWGSLLGPALSLVLPVVYALICGCGILANGLVISIVLSCKHKLVSDVYILNLAVADLLFLVGMPFIIHQLVQEHGWIFGDFLCRAVTTLDLNNQFTSVAIVTVLCVDRYVAVVYSSTVGQKRTLRCTALINAGVWASSLVMATPAMLYARVQRENQTELCLMDLPGPSSLYWYTLYQSLAAFLLPLLVITVLYSLTLHHLFRAMHRAQRRCSARSRRVTRMALTIITAFLICWTPFHVVQLVNLTATPSVASFYLNQLTICLSYAHSCVSPVLVLFCTEFFRERMAHSRYCRFITRWRALRAGTALPSQELTSTVYSPQVGSTTAQRCRRPFGTEQLPCSMTEASVTINGQEEQSAV
ncbi:melanin-concentrating hormone receptor 2-like [Chrysemys picta bellii]|uniref:melanin-concentrating hormone receptor 2-like n=1 Tax=Chrysemys picta bellii TaxID=8478 RepID=UPI0032B24A1C